MDYYYRVLSNVKYFYNTINPATLSGAIDVIVVEQPNGEYMSTPFHVRFGKYGVFNSTEKYVDISINGKEIDLKMKLGENGVAFFVEKAQSEVPDYLVTSPLPGSQQTDTSKLLTESVKSLERHKNEQKRKRSRSSTAERKDSKDSASTFASGRRLISESSDASPSRSHSPEQRSRCQTLDANTAAELAAERKKTLPFSSSVFSSRPYRSLPDLSRILQEDSDADERQVKEKARRKMTTIEPPKPPGTVPRLRHSKSVVDEVTPGVSKPTRRVRIDVPVSESATNDDVLDGLLSTQTSSQRKLAVSEPIDIKTARGEDSDDEDISSSSSSSPSRREKTTDLADDALSDSEVDRHRNIPAGSDVAEWKWGELPKSRDEQLKEEQEKKKAEEKPKVASSWKDWWWGGRSSKAGPSSNQEPGVYLDEIDSSNLQKYLGKANSTRTDSGNGSSRGATSPNSPNAHSDTEGQGAEQGADKTPTQETINDAVGRIRKKQKDSDEDRVRHASNDGYSSGSDIFPLNEEDDAPLPEDSEPRFIRSLRLDSKKLRDLGLTHGANECRFSITTKFQGTTWCSCYIYLYKWYEKLVISDIDGTITKSDVLGHVIPAIGGTWAHAGVAELYTRIKNNGYRMVYLSSRAIGQSHSTKQYLKSVAQDSKVLPDGPVLLSPTSVLVAFRKEVIERRPEEFKIAALSDLKKLFPTKRPFFAGFGNRETDVISYKAVDIPPERILIIDPSGRVRRADSIGYVSSYASMAEETVDYLFPPLSRKSKLTTEGGLVDKTRASFTRPLKHSSFTHWRDTNPETLEDDELAEYETKRKASMDANKKRKK